MPLLGVGVHLPVDLPMWPVTIAIWNCQPWPLDASTAVGVHLPVDLPIWPVTIAIWNCHSWPLDASTGVGVYLPVDLPIWPVTIAIWNCHSWPLDAYTRSGSRSVSESAYVTCNNRNLKLPFLAIRCLYWRGTSASWSAYMTCNNSNLKLPFLATRCLYGGVALPVDLPIWPVTIPIWNCHSWPLDASTWGGGRFASWYMTCNNSNLKLPFLATRCLYMGCTSASWSAYMTCNNRNLKLPFLANRCLYWRVVDLPVDLPIWPVTIVIWNYHSWPLDACTGGYICQLICLYDL